MHWEPEAEALIKRVPFFVRSRVRKQVEEFVRQKGKRIVSEADVLEAKRVLRDKAAQVREGFSVEACFGTSGCPNAVTSSGKLLKKIEALLKEADLTRFLEEKVGGPLKHHHQFRIGLAECPNACSQVHIRDFALIGQTIPEVTGESCLACGECLEVCEEEAISLAEGPVIATERCLACGACAKICPSGTIKSGPKGYRILIGGKLGRHPQLAREIIPLADETQVLETLDTVLRLYKKLNRKGERLGTIIQKVGWERFEELLAKH
ncbi:4Fe-4S dicluster domain-containing protein [Thermosulfuriphilus sp.]